MKKILVIPFLFPLCASAQGLSTEVVVDRTVAVELPSVSPLAGVGPSFKLPVRNDRRLQATDYTETANYKPWLSIGDPSAYTGIAVPPDYRGYAWLGYFPIYNLGIGAGYKVLNSDIDRLDVAAMFTGASWHGPHFLDKSTSQSFNTINLQADYSHTFSSGAKAYAMINYGHDGLRLPWFKALSEDAAPQAFDRFNIAGGIKRDGNINYSAEVYFRSFAVNDETYSGLTAFAGASDKLLSINGHIGAQLGERSDLRFGVNAQHLSNKGFILSGMPRHVDRGEWLVDLNPVFRFSVASVDFRLGAHVDFSNPEEGSKFNFAPDAGILWHAGDKCSIYADFTGGKQFVSQRDAYNYSVFAPGCVAFESLWTKIDALAGFRIGSFDGFSADFHAGYSDSDNALVAGVVNWDGLNSTPSLISADISGWRVGTMLTYDYSDIVKASLGGDVYSHSNNRGYYRLHDNVRFTLSADVSVKVSEQLSAYASYRLRACRHAYYATPVGQSRYQLGNVSDLGIGFNVKVDEQLGVFMRVDNLLCKRYQILPGIQSQRLHGLVGASFNF